MDKFEKARSLINEGLIKQYFDKPNSKIVNTSRGRELCTISPLRNNTKPKSFFINLDSGMWSDFSTKAGKSNGDFITLVKLAYGITPLEAAEKIITDTGGIVPDQPIKKTKSKPKAKAQFPIPKEALDKLNEVVSGEWNVINFGKPSDGTEYRNKKGDLWMCVVRHMQGEEKNDVPYYYTINNQWRPGNPLDKDRPILGIDKLPEDKETPILIVEGEKCQKVPVKDYVSLSWIGGGNQINKTDWKELKEYKNITVWPDCDHKKDKLLARYPDHNQPGLKCALTIKEALPQAKILNVYDKEHPDTWDIADAVKEEIDIIEFIKNTPEYKLPEKKKLPVKEKPPADEFTLEPPPSAENDYFHDDQHFKFLGFDDGRHYFIATGSNIVKKVSMGGFSKFKLLELAPLSYWEMSFHQKKGFDIDAAIDYMIRMSESRGFFKPDRVRGAGVWHDDGRIIVNNGESLQDCKNKKIKLNDSRFHYVVSDKEMGDLSGDVSTEKQGYDLINLFKVQGFEKDIEAMTVLGWSLIAPFCGILKWRPHIWITGPIQTGKSFLLENLVHPIVGPFAFIGSGQDTSAGLYRSLWKDPCPVIKDEMEPGKNKDTRKRIDEVMDTARNASSNFSSYKTISNQHGGVDRFCIRSMFCFSSVVPYFAGDAMESRILICRLKNLRLAKEKKLKTSEMLKTGMFDNPGIYRRKIFKNLKNIIKNVDIIHDSIKDIIHDDRKADNYSPIFAALFSLIHTGVLEQKKITTWLESVFSGMDERREDSDEDNLLKIIFSHLIRIDPVNNSSIAELIIDNEDASVNSAASGVTKLHQHGIKFYIMSDTNKKYLAIAKKAGVLDKILSDTIYSGRYQEVLKRHEFAIDKDPSIRFAGLSSRAILLDWDKIKEKYFEENESSTEELFSTFD